MKFVDDDDDDDDYEGFEPLCGLHGLIMHIKAMSARSVNAWLHY